MKIFFALVSAALLSTLFVGCGKDEEPVIPEPTKTDHISASAWTYENSGIDQDKNGTIDVPLSTLAPGLIQTCRIDNSLTFKRDNTGTADEGGTKCNMADAQTTVYNWSFADNEANLNISNNVFALLNGKSKIVTLNATNFTLSRDTVILSTNVALVVTLKH
jgi:hypothetical protein